MGSWNKVNLATLDNPPSHLTAADHCWYLMDLLVEPTSEKKPWELSPSNRLVYDLKIRPDLLSKSYFRKKKNDAIEVFAQNIARNVSGPRCFMAAPSSKERSDPAYDDRLDLVLLRAQQLNPSVQIVRPLRRTQTIESSHSRSGSRSPADHLPTLAFTDLVGEVPLNVVYFLDDVLTSGSTFKACQQIITTARGDLKVAGIFWARRKIVGPTRADAALADFIESLKQQPEKNHES